LVTGRFVTALAGSPFGLKGFIKIRPLSGESAHLFRLRSVILRRDGVERRYEVEETAGIPPLVAMKFAGIDSPEAAKTLTGAELLIDREEAAPLGPGEFYVEDLKGLEVSAAFGENRGEILGRITGVLEGGGGSLAEIRLNDGSLRLVPFRKEFFGDIDLDKGRAELLAGWILE
jgi:16S rRNA processing protein RimM